MAKEKVTYVVYLLTDKADTIIANDGYYIADGFVTFYFDDCMLVAYNKDFIEKIEVK